MKNDSVSVADKTQQTVTFSVDVENPEGAGLTLVTDVSSAGTGSLTPSILGVTPHGSTYLILAGVAIVADGQQVLKVGRGLPATANVSANDQAPKKLRITFTHNNANPMNYKAALTLHG